jgi:hypothetical protein
MIDIRPYFNSEKVFNAHNLYELESFLPEGWRTGTICKTIRECFVLLNETEFTARIHNGTLKIIGKNEYFTRMMRSIMSDSVVQCMVCGEKGRRWKRVNGQIIRGLPTLCKTHFLEYYNFINEERISLNV